jgi:hypothetical protein
MTMEPVILTLVTLGIAKGFSWLWGRRVFKKVPAPLRGVIETAAKTAALEAAKRYTADAPPPVPRGRK